MCEGGREGRGRQPHGLPTGPWIELSLTSIPRGSGLIKLNWFIHKFQGSKLTLANSQNASHLDNLQVIKISPRKHLRVTIMQISQNIWKEFASGLTSLLVKKFLLAKLCKWIKKLTLCSAFTCNQRQMHVYCRGVIVTNLFSQIL